MEVLGVCVLLSTILVLIDRNQKWRLFWRLTRWSAAMLILGCVLLYAYDRYEARKAQAAAPHVIWDK